MVRVAQGRCLPRGQAGFTLVELLVVITIIAILVALIVPAAQTAREAARQTQCRSNLRQVGIALHLYHKYHDSLPMGAWIRWDPKVPVNPPAIEGRGTMLHYLLPYLEQEALFHKFDFSRTMFWSPAYPKADATTSVLSVPLPVYVCPSDDYRGMNRSANPHRALGNYVGSAGPRRVSATGNNSSKPCACNEGKTWSDRYAKTLAGFGGPGPFQVHNSTTRFRALNFAQIRDGLSNTILVGEVRPKCLSTARSGWASGWNGCGVASTVIPINYDSCTETCVPEGCQYYGNWNTSLGFKSAHPGGAMFLLGDGAVTFLPESIDHDLFQRLGAVSDGEVASIP